MDDKVSGPKYQPSELELDQMNCNFTYHQPKEDQAVRYENLRLEAKGLALRILGSCPPSRERSLALTKLEEAAMWANASIARNE
jgi:hypothetical protein